MTLIKKLTDEFQRCLKCAQKAGYGFCIEQLFSSLTKQGFLLLTYQKVLAQMTMYIVGLIYTCGISSQEYKFI
jgi:predicted histidine transporter YuiF (NhaC family)